MRIWRHGIIWFIVLLVCLALLSFTGVSRTKQKASIVAPRMYDKSAPLGLPPLAVVQPKTDWADIGLKVGSGLGGLMTLVNLIEKFVKMLRRKEQ